MNKKTKFKVGDAIFYPSAGVGTIESIEDLYIAGTCDRCYVIKIEENDITVKVPSSNLDKTGIRTLLDSKKIKELYKILKGKAGQRVTGGNWTERCKELERKINRGSAMDLGEVVRDLLRWKMQTGLSFEESMLLETASNYLSAELATIQGVSSASAVDTIHSQVGVAA